MCICGITTLGRWLTSGRQADSENAEKKVQELQAAKEQADKELKLMEGKLAQDLFLEASHTGTEPAAAR